MLNGWPEGGVWLATRPADMRRSFDGLYAQVKAHLHEDPASGRWYVFVNRRRTMLKILGYEQGGFWIWAKRLEQGLFAPVVCDGVSKALSRTEFLAFLDGVDVAVVRRRKRWVRAPAGKRVAA